MVCLCAQWCRVCDAYHGLFAALALEMPQARFVWVDVEDDEKIAGDLDVETFPTLLIADGHHARFWKRCCRLKHSSSNAPVMVASLMQAVLIPLDLHHAPWISHHLKLMVKTGLGRRRS